MIWMTRYHFEDRIMKKPDWKDAPEWANKLMVGSITGEYAWFGDDDAGVYTGSNGGSACAIGRFELVETRPTDRPHPAAVHAIDPEEPDSDLVNDWLQYDPAQMAFKPAKKSAPDILKAGAQHMQDRAALRDSPEGERSMKRAIEAFNALEGTDLTEVQGWRFMAVLKHARATQGNLCLDDYEDAAAYWALAGEAAQ